MGRATKHIDVDVLREDFHRRYGEGNDFEGSTLIEAVVAAAGLLAETVGPDAVDVAFAALTRHLGYLVHDAGLWADALRDQAFGDAYCWPMGAVLHDLNAYAYYGVALTGDRTAGKRENWLRHRISTAAAFIAKVPFAAWGIDGGDAVRTLERAQARFDLDTGRPIDPAALATLAGVTERRIRNMMAGKEKVFGTDDGKVVADDALAWLSHRPEAFRPSRWREQNSFDDLEETPTEIDEALFVPVASDGSTFHPGLIRDGHFTIGRGQKESRHENFVDALAALQRLSDVAWSRPTSQGIWTTVSATRWVRQTPDALSRLATSFPSTTTKGAVQ